MLFPWGLHIYLTHLELDMKRKRPSRLFVLDEADLVRVLTEALTADVQAVLADQTVDVAADAAVGVVDVLGDGEGGRVEGEARRTI